MKITKCINGHFYDSDKSNICPHCGAAGEAADSTPPKYGFSVPSMPVQPPPRPTHNNVLSGFESCKDTKEPFLFISYAHADAERVKPFFELLEANNFRYWYDEGLPSGLDYSAQIARHIKCAVQVILFFSKNAQNSEYVKDEIYVATKHNKNIFVVYLEDFEIDDFYEIKIERKQCFHAYKFSKAEIDKRFYNEISKDALKRCIIDEDEADTQINIDPDIGIFSKYKDMKLITKTRMNEIYSAVNINTGMKVIVKKAIISNNQNSDFFLQCFKAEKRFLERCRCPFIPQIMDSYEDEESAYIVESYIQGDSPDENFTYDEGFVIDLGIKVAHILKYFFYFGAVHCDIKPNNILLNELGDVFLIDFGASVFVNDVDGVAPYAGTLGYAAPEQLEKKGVIDFRTDIYALGKTMLTLLVNDKISSRNAIAMKSSNITEGFSDYGVTCALDNPLVRTQYITQSLDYYDSTANPALSKVINRMVSPRKEGRYFCLDELIRDLKACKNRPLY